MNVEHDIPGHRFVVRMPEGEGQLVYAVAGPQLLDLLHTEVAPSLRRRGIADALAEAAVDYARRNSAKIIPTCPFVRGWLARHPENNDLLAARPSRGAP
jgi:predicted GNAT family acetyltransferase